MAAAVTTKTNQIALYPDDELRKKLIVESGKRRRKLGPTVIEILLEYFAKQKAA